MRRKKREGEELGRQVGGFEVDGQWTDPQALLSQEEMWKVAKAVHWK